MRGEARSATWVFSRIVGPVLGSVALHGAAFVQAGAIGPGDFDSDAVVLSFDGFVHGSTLSNQLECDPRVLLRATAPIGAEFSADPADWLHPGEGVAPFVAVITAVPPTSTPTPPNKVIATKYDAGGGLIQCERCGIAIEFLDPLPTQVGLYVTDADAGQSVIFSGPTGLLGSVTTVQADGGPEFVGWADPGGISVVVLRSRPTAGIGFDDLTFSGAGPSLCAAPPAPATDSDGDGEPDTVDRCAATPSGEPIDTAGCSVQQFCAGIAAGAARERALCNMADWRNDEPIRPDDCRARVVTPGRRASCMAR